MRRHRSLVPLSRDHNGVLIQARELRRADRLDEPDRAAVAERFSRFFRAEAVRHFREEEELVFPLLLAHLDEPPPELLRALVEHGQLHALTAELRERSDAELLLEIGELLDDHVRLEERILFELVQETVPDERLAAIVLGDRSVAPAAAGDPVVHLLAGAGKGPLWGTATEDLNATVLEWPPGGGTPEHVNEHRDVLLIVLSGSGTVTLDGAGHALQAGDGLVVRKGASRRIEAGLDGMRYLTAHLRRGGLEVGSFRALPGRGATGGARQGRRQRS